MQTPTIDTHRDTAWDRERQLQVLRQVIGSASRARDRIEQVSFRFIGSLLGFLFATSGNVVSFVGAQRLLITVAIVAFGVLAVWAIQRTAIQFRILYAALISIEERLGFYAPNGIGMVGTALPMDFKGTSSDPYIALKVHQVYIMILLLVITLCIIAVWT